MKNSVDTWKSQDASIKNEFGYSEIEVRQDEIISFLKNGYNQIKDVSRDDFITVRIFTI